MAKEQAEKDQDKRTIRRVEGENDPLLQGRAKNERVFEVIRTKSVEERQVISLEEIDRRIDRLEKGKLQQAAVLDRQIENLKKLRAELLKGA